MVASYGVVVESPDGRGCGSALPVVGPVKGDVPPICNWYTLAWLATDRRVVRWLRHGTPGYPAIHAPHLSFELGQVDPALGGARFHFAAGGRSAFSMDEIARPRPGTLAVRGGYWTDTPQGTVKLAISTDDLTSGDATGTVRAGRGSPLRALIGGASAPYASAYSGFSAERIPHGSYRKQVIGPPRPHERLDRFAGSCSLHGVATFAPPAKLSEQALRYSYGARGSCSGTLDGRKVAGAPVTLRQAGPATGSCLRAQTPFPGRGTLRFAGGPAVRYTLDFSSVATEVDYELYGERSGFATGHGSFATQQTAPGDPPRCAGGGLERAPLDMTFTTDTPLASTRSGLSR
jgi:hypothetical protein